MARKIGGLIQGYGATEVIAAADQNAVQRSQLLGDQRRVDEGADTNGDVGCRLDQIDCRIGERRVQPDIGVLAEKFFHVRHHVTATECARDVDPQEALWTRI